MKTLAFVPILAGLVACADKTTKPGPDPGATAPAKTAEAPAASEEKPTAAAEASSEAKPDASEAPAPEESAAPTASGKPATAKTAAAPADKKPTGPVAGKQSTTVASVAAEPGYKCNEKYPHKFVAKGGTNVDYPSPSTRGACSGSGKGISVSVPFTPRAAGPGTVAGTLKYGICDEAKTNCRIVKKPMSLPFTAN